MPTPKCIRTDIAWSELDRITVKRRDLCSEIPGKLSLGHILEEMKDPMAYHVKTWAEQEATAHLRGA